VLYYRILSPAMCLPCVCHVPSMCIHIAHYFETIYALRNEWQFGETSGKIMPTICLLFAYYLPTICLLFAYYLPTICLLFAYYLPTICLLFAYYSWPYMLPIIILCDNYLWRQLFVTTIIILFDNYLITICQLFVTIYAANWILYNTLLLPYIVFYTYRLLLNTIQYTFVTIYALRNESQFGETTLENFITLLQHFWHNFCYILCYHMS
jgi:hypothetical protein